MSKETSSYHLGQGENPVGSLAGLKVWLRSVGIEPDDDVRAIEAEARRIQSAADAIKAQDLAALNAERSRPDDWDDWDDWDADYWEHRGE